VVLMFWASSQTVSPTLMGGLGGVADTEWTSYCLMGTRYRSRRYRWSSLRSVQPDEQYPTQQVQGHFEFRIKALVSEERGHHGRRVRCVVVCKLGQGKEVDPSSCW